MECVRVLKVLLALALIGACSSGGGGPKARESAEAGGNLELPPGVAWRVDEPVPLAQPSIVGRTAVLLGHRAAGLVVFGVDVDSGKVLWEEPTSRGDVVAGIAVGPVVVDSTVLHFAPDPDDPSLAALVALDAAGKERWRSERLAFSAPPEPCFDGIDVCADARGAAGGDTMTWRFDVKTGQARRERGVPRGSRPLAALGLVDLGERDPEFLGRVGTEGVRWRLPLAEAFSDGHSTDYGWHFELFPTAGAFVGSVGPIVEAPEGDEEVRLPLDLVASAGIDAESGRVLWRDAGTQFLCFGSVSPAEDDAEQDEHLLPLRCRLRGTGVASADGKFRFEGLEVSLEGFDPATGATRWAIPLGDAEGLALGEEQPPVATDTAVLLRGPDGPVVVDLVTGKSQRPAPGQVFWCWEEASYSGSPDEIDPEGEDYRGGRLYGTCDADRLDVDRRPEAIPEIVGAHSGELTIVATKEGLIAYTR